MSAYAFMIRLLAGKPGALDAMEIELLRGLVLATVLIWFSFMGGYVHDLRRRLRESGYDRLTGTYTRGRVLDVLAHEQTRCQRGAGPPCVCLFDVDEFKDINDSLGHHIGDLALHAIGQIAHRELRVIDAIGRYGGDEFLLVLSQTDLDGARECAERIRGRIERTDCIGHVPRREVRVSGGVTQYRHGESLQDTLQRADTALYRAKTGGRNRIECA
jgi:diguanylate cyclase (GGDEF)-like protein